MGTAAGDGGRVASTVKRLSRHRRFSASVAAASADAAWRCFPDRKVTPTEGFLTLLDPADGAQDAERDPEAAAEGGPRARVGPGSGQGVGIMITVDETM